MIRDKKGKVLRGLFFFTAILTLFLCAPVADAKQKTDAKVLVIYSSTHGEIDEYQRTLDMLIAHFTTDITFISSKEVKKEDLKAVTHLFYYGQVAEALPASFMKLFDEYSGYLIAFGYNSEQLGDRFLFINPLHEREINQLFLTNDNEKKMDISSEIVVDIEILAGSQTLLEGKMSGSTTTYPVMVKNNKNYYFAFDDISSQKLILVGEILHELFHENHDDAANPAYIRLEDIHPLVDPEHMEEIAEVLKEKDIPYMMAVIPVYTNPETGKTYHFSDSPKLMKVLKEMQKDGGSIVLHGYTHQFRASETGEGFEFWDVESNTPIYADADEEFSLKEEADFATKKEFDKYMNELKKFESEYISAKVTRGIQELVNYGLYPLAFEAPHYTMSQNGYQVLSEYFSTYVGQVQLSDKDWEIMDSTPYITSPSFLNGMQLLPETMSYVRPNDPKAVQKMIDRAEMYQLTRDGVLGAFYHPYLGVDRFNELIEEMEKIEGISWVDLKQKDLWVKADNVDIHTNDGEIIAKVGRSNLLLSSIDFPMYHFNRFIKMVAWAMAIVGGMAVLLFIGLTVFLSSRKANVEG